MPERANPAHKERHIHLRYRMYRCLRSRGWSRDRAAAYAVRNPKSFEALAEAIAIQKARGAS